MKRFAALILAGLLIFGSFAVVFWNFEFQKASYIDAHFLHMEAVAKGELPETKDYNCYAGDDFAEIHPNLAKEAKDSGIAAVVLKDAGPMMGYLRVDYYETGETTYSVQDRDAWLEERLPEFGAELGLLVLALSILFAGAHAARTEEK